MATVDFKVFPHHKKENGQFNVKLVLYHNKKRAYLSTQHYVVQSQLKRDYSIKDSDLIVTLSQELADYRKRISDLGESINSLTALEIGERIMKKNVQADSSIDFVNFSKSHISKLKDLGKRSSAGTLQCVLNNFVDFMGCDVVYTNSITSDLLAKYEAYLRKPYKQTRMNQHKKMVTVQQPGMGDAGIFSHMKDFRILFNACRDAYNDEDRGIIRVPNYPFKKYKLKPAPEPEKRAIEIEEVRKVRAYTPEPGSRAEIGRDIYMLSFYLCGMNATDIYDLEKVTNGRVNYQRSKTKAKRSDQAFFSVKLIPEAKVILDKYLGKISLRYSDVKNFTKAIAVGLKKIAEDLGVEKFDFYSARHTFATEARNTCGFSRDDVAEALNHKPAENAVTDKYIKRDWSRVDAVQAAVVALLD